MRPEMIGARAIRDDPGNGASVCSCEQLRGTSTRYAGGGACTVSASHHPTDIHLRQHGAKKRGKLRARIAAAPASGRATLEAKVERTYSPFHTTTVAPPPPPVV